MEREQGSRLANKVLYTIVIIIAIVPPLVFIVKYQKQIRERTKQRNHAREGVEALANSMKSFEQEEKQREINETTILDFLKYCRDVYDIPKFPGGRIYAHSRLSTPIRVFFFVPEGEHKLIFNARWKFDDEEEFTDGDQWQIPLEGDAGYVLEVKDRSLNRDEPFEWKVIGNHPDFETHTEQMGFSELRTRSMSYREVVAFPGEIDAPSHNTNQRIFNVRLSGPHDDRTARLTVEAFIESKTPAVVSADQARRYSKPDKPLKPYQGGGRFVVAAPDTP